MTIKVALLTMTMMACGPDAAQRGDDTPPSDGPSAPTDANDVTEGPCKANIRLEIEADGSKQERRTYFFVDTSTHGGDRFQVEMCNRMDRPQANTACPAGSTCTQTGDPLPAGPECIWQSSGTFIDDNLFIACGSGATNTNANGMVTFDYDSYYTIVRVHR